MTDNNMATVDTRPPMVVLRDRLQQREGELRAALTDISPEQFIRAVMTSAAINPDILACSWNSLWLACMRACRDGLLPDGTDGAIVPYKQSATWIPMYQGLLRRFRRSGQFRWITANVVRQGEEFTHYIDQDGEHFKHVPGYSDTAPVIKIYALATTKDGGVFVNVMSKAEVDKVRSMSRASRDDSPWKMWESEMQKKTALRRLCKMLPSARDLMPDDDDEPAPPFQLTPVSPPPQPEPQASLAARPVAARGEVGGEQDDRPDEADAPASVTREDAPAARTSEPNPPAAADASGNGVMSAAYSRGQTDKARGFQRKAVPPEYREPGHTREALSWQAGFDGSPMPSFGEQA